MKTWRVGPVPVGSPSRQVPNIDSLGETAVDFDFATPTIGTSNKIVNKGHDWNQINWPILVLYGNGDVFIIRGNVLSEM